MKYSEKVRPILDLDANKYGHKWPDYPVKYGFGAEDIPELMRVVGDGELYAAIDNLQFYARVHAIRALAQLQAAEAIELIVGLDYDDDWDEWLFDSVSEAMAMFGEQAIAANAKVFSDGGKNKFRTTLAVRSLGEIGKKYPETQGKIVDILAGFLQSSTEEQVGPNSSALVVLMDFKAIEKIDIIRDAFDKGLIDPMMAGDIEDVEIRMGLRKERDTPKENPMDKLFGPVAEVRERLREECERRSATIIKPKKVGRNDPCSCGSGKKYKKCCL